MVYFINALLLVGRGLPKGFLFDRRGGGPKLFGYIWNVCVAGDLDVFGIRFISLKMMIFYELLIREQ